MDASYLSYDSFYYVRKNKNKF